MDYAGRARCMECMYMAMGMGGLDYALGERPPPVWQHSPEHGFA